MLGVFLVVFYLFIICLACNYLYFKQLQAYFLPFRGLISYPFEG